MYRVIKNDINYKYPRIKYPYFGLSVPVIVTVYNNFT